MLRGFIPWLRIPRLKRLCQEMICLGLPQDPPSDNCFLVFLLKRQNYYAIFGNITNPWCFLAAYMVYIRNKTKIQGIRLSTVFYAEICTFWHILLFIFGIGSSIYTEQKLYLDSEFQIAAFYRKICKVGVLRCKFQRWSAIGSVFWMRIRM